MNKAFGEQLRNCRKEADLTQKQLGQRIGRDGSTISRFESGRVPAFSTLEDIVNALHLCGVPQEELNHLSERARYQVVEADESPAAHQFVAFVNRVFDRLSRDEAALLGDDLRRVVEMYLGYFAAVKDRRARRWKRAAQSASDLRTLNETRSTAMDLLLLEELAQTSYHRGRFGEAVEYGELALLMARHVDRRRGGGKIRPDSLRREGRILRRRGSAYRRLARWAEATKSYGRALRLFGKVDDALEVAVCYRKLAAVLLFQSRVGKALRLLNKSLRICEELDDVRGTYKGMQHKAWALRMQGRWEEATNLSLEALKLIREMGMEDVELKLERAKASMFLGDTYHVSGKLTPAKGLYERAQRILQDLEKRDIHVRLLSGMISLGLGRTYVELEGHEWEEAENHLRESRDAHMALGEPLRIPLVESAYGLLLLKRGNLSSAEAYLQQARDRFVALGNNYFLGETLVNLSRLYRQASDSGALHRMAGEVERTHRELFEVHLARIRAAQGAALLDDQEYAEGIEMLLAASEAALKYNSEVFSEVFDTTMGEVERLLRKRQFKQAEALCEEFEGFWARRPVKRGLQEVVDACVLKARQKRREISSL